MIVIESLFSSLEEFQSALETKQSFNSAYVITLVHPLDTVVSPYSGETSVPDDKQFVICSSTEPRLLYVPTTGCRMS